MNISSVQKYENVQRNVNPKNRNISCGISKTDSVHFGGAVTSGVNGAFKWLESAGFFVQFLIVDTLSMVAPRAWVGFHRDKDKTGKYNVQAGLEEFGRESLSGPTMNIIPMVCAGIAINHFSPTVKLDNSTFVGMNNSLKGAVKEGESGLTKAIVDERLAGQIFDDAFGSNNTHEDYVGLRKRFVETLEQASGNKIRTKIEKIRNIDTTYSKAEAAFDKLVVEINNKFCGGIAPDDPHQIKLKDVIDDGKPVTANSQTFFEDFSRYSKGVVEKLLQKDSSQTLEKFLEERASKAKLAKNVLAGIAFLAVGGFLLGLPKIYQQGKTSPAEQSAKRAQGGANENK